MGCTSSSKAKVYVSGPPAGSPSHRGDTTSQQAWDSSTPGKTTTESPDTGSTPGSPGVRPGGGSPTNGAVSNNSNNSNSTQDLIKRSMSNNTRVSAVVRMRGALASSRILMTLPARIRRISIIANSYNDAAVSPSNTGERTSEAGDAAAAKLPPSFPKSDTEKTFLLESLTQSFLFAGLSEADLATVVDAMFLEVLDPGQRVITQGDDGDRFYVVATGTLTVEVSGNMVDTLKEKQTFGELALMYNCPRSASVTAVGSGCTIWALDRDTFKRIVVRAASTAIQEKVGFLRRVEILSSLNRQDLVRLAEVVYPVRFEKGTQIVTQGDAGDVFYFIRAGQVSVYKRDTAAIAAAAKAAAAAGGGGGSSESKASDEEVEVIRLGIGSYFGEQAIIHNQPRSATVRALTDVDCLAMHSDYFTPMLGGVVSGMHAVHSRREMAEVRVLSSRRLMRSLDSLDASSSPKSASGGSPSSRGGRRGGGSSAGAASAAAGKYAAVELADLQNVAVLGEGAFGVVRLVRHPPSGGLFALKVMQKARIVEMNQQRNILMEKNIMMRANHPYILKLYKTFQDRDCLYMLLEFCQGGDMFTLLGREGGRLKADAARHYAGVVTTALEYLHARSIAYRDLKPENLVFDAGGYLKVVDFGFAKIVRDRTYTLCGTPEYLAPELVQGNGHHQGVDYWALGILIYEMLCGYSPFADHADNNQLVIYKQIVAGKYVFPSSLRDGAAKSLIRRLLEPKASKRLGCLPGGAAEIRKHEWFTGFDFKALLDKRLPPPFVPHVTGPTDLSLFDEIEDPGMSRVVPYQGDGTNWDADF